MDLHIAYWAALIISQVHYSKDNNTLSNIWLIGAACIFAFSLLK